VRDAVVGLAAADLGGARDRRWPPAGRSRGEGPGAGARRPRIRLRQRADRAVSRAPARLLTHGVGVAAAPWAGAELELDARLDGALDDDEDDDEPLDDEGVADSDALRAVEDGAAEELAAVELAGAEVAGEDGVGVVAVVDEDSASSPSVVVPDDDELVTSAETGFCPTSSIPVTIAIATTNTETA
jgi:hypothetical protein